MELSLPKITTEVIFGFVEEYKTLALVTATSNTRILWAVAILLLAG
jgi:hypothetical protein